jgi:hypothetical protein
VPLAAEPASGNTSRLPSLYFLFKLRLANREELRSVIETRVTDAARSHASADAASFIYKLNAPATRY